MPQISRDSPAEIMNALERYVTEVNAAPLALRTKNTYILHADSFVRWLKDEFEPGVNKKRP